MGSLHQFKRQGFREGTGQSCYYGQSYERQEFRLTWPVIWFYLACLAAGLAYGIVEVL